MGGGSEHGGGWDGTQNIRWTPRSYRVVDVGGGKNMQSKDTKIWEEKAKRGCGSTCSGLIYVYQCDGGACWGSGGGACHA